MVPTLMLIASCLKVQHFLEGTTILRWCFQAFLLVKFGLVMRAAGSNLPQVEQTLPPDFLQHSLCPLLPHHLIKWSNGFRVHYEPFKHLIVALSRKGLNDTLKTHVQISAQSCSWQHHQVRGTSILSSYSAMEFIRTSTQERSCVSHHW